MDFQIYGYLLGKTLMLGSNPRCNYMDGTLKGALYRLGESKTIYTVWENHRNNLFTRVCRGLFTFCLKKVNFRSSTFSMAIFIQF